MTAIKQDLIDILKATQDVGFRESNVCDDELQSLLTDLADELGIPAGDYHVDLDHEKTWDEIIAEANEIEAIREASEKPTCKASADSDGLEWKCNCDSCWFNEFDNCICGNCSIH